MKSIAIIGGGQPALNILKTVLYTKNFKVISVVAEANSQAGSYAEKYQLHRTSDRRNIDWPSIDIIIHAEPDDEAFLAIRNEKSKSSVIIPYGVVNWVSELISEKEQLIQQLEDQTHEQQMILDLTQDAMIAIDKNERISLFNPSAERMTGLKREKVFGQEIGTVMPSSKLPRILETGHPEVNQEQELDNGKKIITTRLPIQYPGEVLHGAFAVFKDITEVEELAEEVTNLKSIQTMLHAIIQSSEEAITVVDENGKGIMINPAYTKLTGLREEDVIGQPATADITEGESVHLQVLKTRKPVRGARMKVGQNKRDVIVNVAPIIVNGKLKGSTGVIHDVSEITSLTKELDRARQIIRTLEAKYAFEDIIGESEEFQLVVDQAKLAATTPIMILLRGESGTGKELFAHAIHNVSKRKFNKFVRVNCAAISESLLESEIFGYEEGAFSGAKKGGKRGYFEEAHHGSIFLDEIGELSMQMQAKLLRVLQEKELVRVGGTKPVPIDVRVITATNVNLEKRIAEGTFREDLYYRLNRMPIYIPPLRHRLEDLDALCEHLIGKINQDFGRNVEGLSKAAMKSLKMYDWPGNVRELENVLGRAVINMAFYEKTIMEHHLPFLSYQEPAAAEQDIRTANHQTLSQQMSAYERDVLRQTLKANRFNKTKSAKELGISVRSLYYKLEKYNLEKMGMQ